MLETQRKFQFQQALKIALACVIDIFIVNWFDIPFGFFTVMASVMLMTLFHDQTFAKGIERVLGPAIATLLLIICLNISQNEVFFYFMMILILLTGTYLYFRERFGYAAMLGSVIGGAIFLESVQSPDLGIQLGLDFIKVTIIGVVVSWFVTVLIWPVKSDRDLYPNLFMIIDLLPTVLQGGNQVSLKNFVYLKQLLDYSKRELKSSNSYYNHLNFIFSLKQLYIKISSYHQILKDLQKTKFFQEKKIVLKLLIDNYVTELTRYYKQLADNFRNKKSTTEVPIALNQAIVEFETYLTEERQKRSFAGYNIQEVWDLFSIVHSAKAVIADLETMQRTLHQLVNDEMTTVQEEFIKKVENHKLFPIHILSLKRAIKLALADLIMLICHYYFGWYSGIQAIIVVTVILAQPNLGRSQRRMVLRFMGIIYGGIWGFLGLVMLTYLPYFGVFLAFMFFSILLCEYVALSGEKYGYAGIQAAFILALLMMSSNGLAIDLTVPIERFIGVFQGVIVGMIIAVVLWPEHPVAELKKNIASSLEFCLLAIDKIFAAEKLIRATALTTLEQQLQTQQTLLYDANCMVVTDNKGQELLNLLVITNNIYLILIMLIDVLEDDSANEFTKSKLSFFTLTLADIKAGLHAIISSLRSGQVGEFDFVSSNNRLLDQLEKIRNTKETYSYSNAVLENYAKFTIALYRLLQDLNQADKVITELNQNNRFIKKYRIKAHEAV